MGPALLGVAGRTGDPFPQHRSRRLELCPCRPGLVAELVRRDADGCLLALSGDLSRGSAEVVTGALTNALVDVGRVVVDVSGLRLSWNPAAQVFASALDAAGGWPAARLVLLGAGATLADSLATSRVPDIVPLAPDEATARQLLLSRPPAVARHLDLDGDSSSPRRARLFVDDASRQWGLGALGDDAVLVASELVGNAVAHARTSCRLDLRLDGLGLTIAVRDYDYRGLLVPLACSTAGRREHGLFLVASISRAWGVSPTENGKSVWALLPLSSSVTDAEHLVAARRWTDPG
jgi:hypothetical protein